MPLSQALAEELDITPEEAEELVDVEPLPIEGHEDVPHGYVFDFEGAASPNLHAKLMQQRGSLQLRVPLWFFERVATDI